MKLEKAEQFDKYICEGILSIEQKKYDASLDFFSKAVLLFPDSKEGYLYRFLSHIARYNSGNKPE